MVQRRASLTAYGTAEIGLGVEKALAHPHLLNSAGDSRLNGVIRLHSCSSKARKPDGLRHCGNRFGIRKGGRASTPAELSRRLATEWRYSLAQLWFKGAQA